MRNASPRSPDAGGGFASIRSTLARLIGVVRGQRGLAVFVATLAAIDLLFIGNYAVTRTLRSQGLDAGFLGREELRLTADHGYPEIFNYAKNLLVVLALARLARSTRQLVYVALSAVFLLILLDDSLAIHERVGEVFVGAFSLRPALGLRAQDFGELATWALLAGSLTPLLVLGLWRSDARHAGVGLALLVPLVALFAFGVVFDQLYHVLKDSFAGAGILLDTIEDGGEMLAMTAACALALAAERSLARPR